MKNAVYTISARGKKLNQHIKDYLEQFFSKIPVNKIDSVFGFVEPSPLYSGRAFLKRQISDSDYEYMHEHKIGLRVPFTNHYVSEEEYEEVKPLLDKYHSKGNSLITTNEWFTKQIRKEFPKYRIEASILKNIHTHEMIEEALKLYDTVVLPMNVNLDEEFLKSIQQKSKITLFGNAGCALTCPDRICYEYFSRKNKVLVRKKGFSQFLYHFINIQLNPNWCTHRLKPRKLHGVSDFDIDRLAEFGFTRFKMLREHPERQTGY